MEIRTVEEKPIHVCHPLINLNFGTDRTKSAFTGMRNITYFTGMDGASKGRETKPIRFSVIHDLPDIESYSPSNQCRMDTKESIPVLLKDEL